MPFQLGDKFLSNGLRMQSHDNLDERVSERGAMDVVRHQSDPEQCKETPPVVDQRTLYFNEAPFNSSSYELH